MVKLVIIADDFTGALDTGVQFAGKGAKTLVVTDLHYDFHSMDKEVEVLVMVTESRHLPSEEAYGIVRSIVERALKADIPYIYKKTDSALRGNIGSELKGLMDGAKIRSLPFIPAFPALRRITKEGIHYIEGVPVAESIFGEDPFEPILHSSVEMIIGSQVEVPVVVEREGGSRREVEGIRVYDAETEEDLRRIAEDLTLTGLRFSAGCAGFAATLSDLLGLDGEDSYERKLDEPLFIACGSVNAVTIRQMRKAKEEGFPQVHLTPEQKLDKTWLLGESAKKEIQGWIREAASHGKFILDVNDPEGSTATEYYKTQNGLTTEELRVSISENLAAILKQMLDSGLRATVLCTGGDTLMALMEVLKIYELTPLYEIAPGVVATKFQYHGRTYNMISKSGGIGDEDLLLRIAEQIQ